ncbi:MAG: hypothetical protein FWG29_11755 [Treponema sp.]|nr:hypothetical protein [Treponema sp.]
MFKNNDVTMLLGADDLTFIRFGNPAHFRKEAVSRSDTIKDRMKTLAFFFSRKSICRMDAAITNVLGEVFSVKNQ